MTHPHINYRGYFGGPKDTGGMTAHYPTKEEALRRAEACANSGDTIWTNPVYIGPLDAVLLAVEPLEYIDWRGKPQRKVIKAGEEFRPGDIVDHQFTLDRLGEWLEQGKVQSLPVAEREEP